MQPTLQHYQVTLTLTNVVTAQVNIPVAAACAAVGAPFRDEALHPKICNYHPFTVKLSGQWAPTLVPDVQQVAYALYAALVSVHGPQVAVDIEVTGIYHAPVARAVHSITTPAPIAVNGGFNMGDRVIIRCTTGVEVFTIVGFPQRRLAPGIGSSGYGGTAILSPHTRNGQPWRGRTRERSVTMLERAPEPPCQS